MHHANISMSDLNSRSWDIITDSICFTLLHIWLDLSILLLLAAVLSSSNYGTCTIHINPFLIRLYYEVSLTGYADTVFT